MSNSKSPSRKSPMERRFASKALSLAVLAASAVKYDSAAAVALRDGDFAKAVSVKVDPCSFESADSFRDEYFCSSLMSKFPGFNLGLDLDAAALSSFLESEERCSAAAARLKAVYVNGLISRVTPESILWSAREKIRHLLGPFCWDDAEPYFSFGPGATVSVPHRKGDPYYKFGESTPTVTRGCMILAYTAIRRVPRWIEHVATLKGKAPDYFSTVSPQQACREIFEVVDGNRVTFVPKDAKKLRTIAIEPTMNGFIQHGIGGLIRNKLRRIFVEGQSVVNLDDQSVNQTLACLGSIDGTLATVDLSAASDSVSLGLVESLLPADWYEAICLCRSPVGTLPSGRQITYSKVSSMGNGYTFELESLIFWALCSAVIDLLRLRDRRLAVYGDDIIIPVSAWPSVKWILEFVGFTANTDKTFVSGPFRESCGKHYFHGTDVTPVYIREDIASPSRLIWFCNQIRRWARLFHGLDPRLKTTYEHAVALLPPSLRRPSIPDGIGDFALFGDLDESSPSRMPFGIDAWVASSWLPVVSDRQPEDLPFLLRQLSPLRPSVMGVPSNVRPDEFFRLGLKQKWVRVVSLTGGVPCTGRATHWRRYKIPVQTWPSFGPWLGT